MSCVHTVRISVVWWLKKKRKVGGGELQASGFCLYGGVTRVQVKGAAPSFDLSGHCHLHLPVSTWNAKKRKNAHTRSSTPFNSYNVLLPWEGWYLVESLLSGKTCQVWSTQRLITTGTSCPYCRTPKWRPTYFSVWCLWCTSRTSLHPVSFLFFIIIISIPFVLCFFFFILNFGLYLRHVSSVTAGGSNGRTGHAIPLVSACHLGKIQ